MIIPMYKNGIFFLRAKDIIPTYKNGTFLLSAKKSVQLSQYILHDTVVFTLNLIFTKCSMSSIDVPKSFF